MSKRKVIDSDLIEERAEIATLRHDRRYLWLWLIISTSFSLAFNIGWAWLLGNPTYRVAANVGTPELATPPGVAMAAAVVPPILLMAAIEGIPRLARMMKSDNDRLLTAAAWIVVVVAFVWSAHGIYSFVIATGLPAALAWAAPVGIDISVAASTRALVVTAPIAARLKAREAYERRRELEAEQHVMPRSPAPKPRPSAQRSASPQVAADAAPHVAAPSPDTARGDAASAHEAPQHRSALSDEALLPDVTPHRAAAARIATSVPKHPDEIASVLALHHAGISGRKIHERIGTDPRMVSRIVKAHRELVDGDQGDGMTDDLEQRQLTAVG